jgi:hypothetical protein
VLDAEMAEITARLDASTRKLRRHTWRLLFLGWAAEVAALVVTRFPLRDLPTLAGLLLLGAVTGIQIASGYLRRR